MAEWLVEEGIGEHRAILVEGGKIVAARVDWLARVRAGAVVEGQLVAKRAGSRRGTARLGDGTEVLVDQLPPEVTEGMRLRLRVVREAVAERGRNKLPLARQAATHERLSDAPSLRQQLAASGATVRLCRPADRQFEHAGWDELVEEALSGAVAFAGGSLMVSPTPAMTLIDIDGDLAPPALALAAVPAIAETLRRFDLGGSVGIDFPSLAEREARRAVDTALGKALAGWPHERTAMNGFGFVQLVARLERPSLVARYQLRPGFVAAQALARQAEALAAPGRLLLCANPAIIADLPPGFEAELARRTGRVLDWNLDPALALTAPYVQALGA